MFYLLIIFLILTNAYFVATEFALVGSKKDKIDLKIESGNRSAKAVSTALENLSTMLSGCQLGITICSIFLGSVIEPWLTNMFLKPLTKFMSETSVHIIGFLIAIAIISVLHFMFGEMVPKNIVLNDPERSAMILIHPLRLFVKLTRPIIWFYNLIMKFILLIFGIKAKESVERYISDPTQIGHMIGQSHKLGIIQEFEFNRITKAISMHNLTVKSLIIPMNKLVVIKGTTDKIKQIWGPTIGDARKVINASNHSRFPVLDEENKIRGYIHVKDIISELTNIDLDDNTIIDESRLHPIRRILDTTSIDTAVALLRRDISHLGYVQTKNGSILGIVTLDDMVKEFMGTVQEKIIDPEPSKKNNLV